MEQNHFYKQYRSMSVRWSVISFVGNGMENMHHSIDNLYAYFRSLPTNHNILIQK